MQDVFVKGPIPEKRGAREGSLRGILCLIRRSHRFRAWLAPPGTPMDDDPTKQAFRLGRCYTCGLEFAD
jgi:hypothetical protein